MSVTADQWAQAEAERQVQADLVQTLNNEGRRLGSEENNNLLEILRPRTKLAAQAPTLSPRGSQASQFSHRNLQRDAGSSTHEWESFLRSRVTKARGVTRVSSCVPLCQPWTSNSAK